MFQKTFNIIIINLLLIINSYSNELKITSENLEVDRENKITVFLGDVYAYNKDIKIWSEKLIVKFDNKENEIEQLNAENSVKIIKEEITAKGDIGLYYPKSKILNLNPELIRRLAIGLPIVPSPMKAIFGIYSSKLYGVLFFSLFGKPP